MQAYAELAVVGDGLGPGAADFLEHGLFDQQQGAGDAEHAVDAVEADSGPLEAACVFNFLIEAEQAVWQAAAGDGAVLDSQAVGGADHAAGGSQIRIEVKWTSHVLQAVTFEHTVGIDDAKQWIAAEVDADVDCIGAPAVLFADHQEFGVVMGLVERMDLMSLDFGSLVAFDGLELEVFLQPLNGLVGGPVVDDDHLVDRVV